MVKYEQGDTATVPDVRVKLSLVPDGNGVDLMVTNLNTGNVVVVLRFEADGSVERYHWCNTGNIEPFKLDDLGRLVIE